jgi:hypothetical protein
MTRTGVDKIYLLDFLSLMHPKQEMKTTIRPVLCMIVFYKYPVADDDQLPEFVVLRDMKREAILRNRII